jgi:hypothetical protein
MPASRLAFGAIALTFAAFSLSACGDAGQGQAPGEPVGQTEQAFTFPNDPTACQFFVGKGLTDFQAAGIVGNLDQESGDDPNSVQAGGPGRGIAQWSVGGRWDTSPGDNAVAFASSQGQNVLSLQLQLEFVWYELSNFSGYGLGALRASTNITDATVTFQTDFEGCGVCDQSNRIAYAQAALSSCGSPPAYGASFVGQSFPLATSTLTMVEGQVIPSYIELKNTGSKSWDSDTHIETTQPRDRKSAFADSTWLAPNRPAGASGTVKPGDTFKFTFDLAAPQKAGQYDEFFGVVQDGVAWFSDQGQGGPPDNDLEVKIDVVAPEYRGEFKDQSFPLAPSPTSAHVGDVVTGYIELTNTGGQPWKAGTTKLAPIPRDKASPFADSSWLSPTRVSTVAADVAPGAVGRFPVALDANDVGDTEIGFGLVEEGVTWFADATLGGGPADGFLKVHLVVVPQGAPLPDGGVGAEDDGGAGTPGTPGAPAGQPGNGEQGPTGGYGTPASAASGGGCSVGPVAGGEPGAFMGAGVFLVMALAVRTRKRDTRRPSRF